jgi:hypothetical protein
VYSNAQVSFFFFCFRFCLATSCEQVQLEVPARSFLVMENIPSHREECRSRRICVRTICFQAEASPVSSKRLLQLCLDVCSDCGAECVLETTMSSSSLYSESLLANSLDVIIFEQFSCNRTHSMIRSLILNQFCRHLIEIFMSSILFLLVQM